MPGGVWRQIRSSAQTWDTGGIFDVNVRVLDIHAKFQQLRERGWQFSSYDRKSHAGRDDPEAWYANHDRGQFLREEVRDGQTEYVLADCEGPGAVVRIWSAKVRM